MTRAPDISIDTKATTAVPLDALRMTEMLPSDYGDDRSEPTTHENVNDDAVMQVLWGDNGEHSTSLDYVRTHAHAMIRRVVAEDPHNAYIPLRCKSQDVRLFKVATLMAATPLEHERCDFRGVTRVPGSLDTVLEMLASEDERESYWVALNTHKGLLVNSLFATRRLQGNNAPFPRWNQRYTATKFSKQSPPVECCFNEYATFYPFGEDEMDASTTMPKRVRVASKDSMDPDNGTLRRAFVYRRSIDHRLFNMEDVQDKLSKYGETCERLYLAESLFEVAETSEKHICKVVFTCSVYITDMQAATNKDGSTNDSMARAMRHEYREFCTNMLLNLRQVMMNQWVDQMASAGVVGLSSSPTAMLSRSLGRRMGGALQPQAARCGVCSSGFSLLKKRNVCHLCSLVVCSRCCTKQERGSVLLHQRTASAHDINSRRATKECILCSQFGADASGGVGLSGPGGSARLSVGIRRHFTSSAMNSSRSITATSEVDEDVETLSDSGHDGEEEDVKVVLSPEDLDMNSGVTPVGEKQTVVGASTPITTKPKNLRVRSATEDNTIASAWREPDAELPPRQTPTRRRFKQRCESVNLPSTSSTRGQGIVLLTDIDNLSLTGSFHRLSTASTAPSAPGSRRGSGGSENGSVVGSSTTPLARPPVHASPLMPPRRPVRSISEDTTLLLSKDFKLHKAEEQVVDIDDLANFTLELS